MSDSFYSNGKLLITGEYAVLDGALSLAVPTKYGQWLFGMEVNAYELHWKSLDENGKIWFESTFDLISPEQSSSGQSSPTLFTKAQRKPEDERAITHTLSKILREAKKLNPDFLKNGRGYNVETKLTFPRDWGLGSSSTLINNIAQWAKVDAHQLLWNAFSGSGYDIACAQSDYPILYCLVDGEPTVTEVDFNPTFQDQLYFVHLNKKQNSREGISSYRKKDFDKAQLIDQVSEITIKTVSCTTLSAFESLLNAHEMLLSQTLGMPTVKEVLFPDFKGSIKSLGAWGGDFVLATGDGSTPSYFEGLGYGTVVTYADMVLQRSR